MNITINRTKLEKALSKLKGITSKRSTLPILNHCLITASKGTAEIRATDLDREIVLTLDDVTGSGSVAVPCGLLHAIVSRMTGEVVEIGISNKYVATLKCGSSTAQLSGVASSEFTKPFDVEGQPRTTFTIDGGKLAHWIKIAIPFISVDTTRFVLCGIYVESAENVRLIATTGTHMIRITTDATCDVSPDSILPLDSCAMLAQTLTEGEAEVHFYEKFFTVMGEGWAFTSRLIEGTFPNYKQVIPKELERHFEVDRQEFIDAIDFAQLPCAPDMTPIVNINAADGLATVKTNRGENRNEISIGADGKSDFQVDAVKMKYCLNAYDSEKAKIFSQDNRSPIVMDSDNILTIVMPCRI